MNTPHFMLVDDDVSLLEALPHMISLRIHGVQVDTFASAREALEHIQQYDYDAIVSDIKMPEMDGLELLAKIQELRPEIPTLLITGHGDQMLITQALRGGAYDFIQKPIDRVYFVAALHRAMQTRQLRRQVKEQQLALKQRAQSLEQLVEERSRQLLVTDKAMEELVHDLLDFSLIETNTLVLQYTRCNLVALCQRVLDAYSALAGLALIFECSENVIVVEVDLQRISQVLIKLLANAHQYSPEGSPITITVQRTAEEAIVTVRDKGIGISEAMLPHIFERFYQATEVETRTGSRTRLGLGLYISQRIVEQHDGHIELQSSPGSGSAFSVVLPIATEAPTEQADETTQHEPSSFQPPEWIVS